MLNSTQGSEDNKKVNKRKAHASVFDLSEGTGSPTGGENGYKGKNEPSGLSYPTFYSDVCEAKELLQRIADKYQISDGISLNIISGKANCFIDASKVAID